jgi:hypothetical protein
MKAPVIVGDRARFAIEAEPRQHHDRRVLGGFRLWLFERAFGDWNDAADLLGCVGWLEDLATKPRQRLEPSLDLLSPEEVFRRIYDPAMAPDARWDAEPEGVRNVYSRFNMSHIGMSAFDRVDVLLLHRADGTERCLCREMPSGQIFGYELEPREVENVAAAFAREFRRAVASER